MYVTSQAVMNNPLIQTQPVVQYWYMFQPGSSVDAGKMWNHLNLLGCAVTEHHAYKLPCYDGYGLSFHTSEACTAWRVSEAYKDSSSPQIMPHCDFYGKNDGTDSSGIAETVVEGFLEGLFAAGEPV